MTASTSECSSFDIIVIGGGAAGFFAAIHAKNKNNTVAILEKSNKLLAKVKVSGGGRCNVTHACFDNGELAKFYPRGERQLKKAFYQFNPQSTIDWFEKRGVQLYAQPDNRMFPISNNSQSIIDCLLNECQKNEIEIRCNQSVQSIEKKEGQFIIQTATNTYHSKKVIIATGGQPTSKGLQWITALGINTVAPVPSLFTFNIPSTPLQELMGNSVEKASVKIDGTKLVGKGAVLITHWGLSGPAILQLSAWGARLLAEKNYHFSIFVNWLNETKEEELKNELKKQSALQGEKMLHNANPFPITNKIWQFLLQKHDFPTHLRWKDVKDKNLQKLVNSLLFDKYTVAGKTTFKEEFVTAGGIDLNEINFQTMEAKKVEGLYFTGEILDIDGITGGFNFQAAWTTGYIAGKNASETMGQLPNYPVEQ